jgi:hypothetical protein
MLRAQSAPFYFERLPDQLLSLRVPAFIIERRGHVSHRDQRVMMFRTKPSAVDFECLAEQFLHLGVTLLFQQRPGQIIQVQQYIRMVEAMRTPIDFQGTLPSRRSRRTVPCHPIRALCPPSTGSITPVMNFASSDARNRAA